MLGKEFRVGYGSVGNFPQSTHKPTNIRLQQSTFGGSSVCLIFEYDHDPRASTGYANRIALHFESGEWLDFIEHLLNSETTTGEA